MKTCKKCDHMNPDSAAYCENCGSSDFLRKKEYRLKPVKGFLKCSRCGEENPSTAINCLNCGEKLSGRYELVSDEPAPETVVQPEQAEDTVTDEQSAEQPGLSEVSEPQGTNAEIEQPETNAETDQKHRRLKPWQTKAILAACFVAVFFAGFGSGKINMVRKETFYKVTDSYEDILGENNYYKEQIAQYEVQIAEYKNIIEPYKQLSAAELAERTAAANLKAKQDEEALAQKQAAEKAAADKAAAEKAAAEKAAAEAAAAEAAKGYETGITYDNLARTPDNYVGKKVKFRGKVVQVMEGADSTQIRLAVNSDYDTILYCTVPKAKTANLRILEDDIITIFGVSQGLLTYTSTLGGQITIPSVSVDDWGPN